MPATIQLNLWDFAHRSDLTLILISLGSLQLQISQEKQYFSRFLYITTHDYKCYGQWDVIVLWGRKFLIINYKASILPNWETSQWILNVFLNSKQRECTKRAYQIKIWEMFLILYCFYILLGEEKVLKGDNRGYQTTLTNNIS